MLDNASVDTLEKCLGFAVMLEMNFTNEDKRQYNILLVKEQGLHLADL